MARKRSRKAAVRDVAAENFNEAVSALYQHPLFSPILYHSGLNRREGNLCPTDGWAVVTPGGWIHAHPTRRGEKEEWTHVIAHCLLHLGFGHLRKRSRPLEWNAACEVFVERFLKSLKLGRPPLILYPASDITAQSEERLYDIFCERGVPDSLMQPGLAGASRLDMLFPEKESAFWGRKWPDYLAQGLVAAVTSAVEIAAGRKSDHNSATEKLSVARRARQWFLSSFPLLGALCAAFEIVEDPVVCARNQISVAAVDPVSKEIFINPQAGLTEEECRFVMAHELLHVGLQHASRRRGRDRYLWNVACDYIINSWLVEMRVGELPGVGLLMDPNVKQESSESIYDRITTDLRKYRKLFTMRGVGLSDILERETSVWTKPGEGIDLDESYRRCIAQGLQLHQLQERGFLPAGLVEEIRALSEPPIPWDVELAQWFDEHFPPVAQVRSYAQPSRRQAATPDIPRPRWANPPEDNARTFGVVLDTSGSMDRTLLAKSLGAIAGYSMSREVTAVRVVFCDAAVYDQGYMAPEAIAGRVQIRGRGGTVLQPAINLLEEALDFPKGGPLLIITDGYCDRLIVRREHALLIPEGHNLPFVPKGKVFRIR